MSEQIDKTDKVIDGMVNELGACPDRSLRKIGRLSEEEIRIVEGEKGINQRHNFS